MKLKTLLILFFISLFYSSAQASYEKSVVRIASTISLYDYKAPWKAPKRKNIVGSGVIIENGYILTAAHVVSNAKTIEIKKSNKRKKYFAKIKYISPQADLALLKVYDNKFFKNTKALKIEDEVEVNDEVFVAGYPLSRKDLLIKKGKISKIEQNAYSFSDEDLLSLEIKANIKHGNSGGPILNKKGAILGIAMQKPEGFDGTAYAVPSSIIKVFLEDIKDKKIDGFYSNSNSYQYIRNKTLQEYYKIKEEAILVSDIDIEEKQLKVNDIIFKIDGEKISNKTIFSEKEFLSQLHKEPVGNSIKLSILRDKKILHINYKLKNYKKLLVQEFNKSPRYYIFGGLVFTPITRNYLQALGMSQYEMNMLFYQEKRTKKLQERVAWMEDKFEHPINKAYKSKVEIVNKVNDIKVKSFKHFVTLIKESKQKYIVIDFLKKQRVILEKEEAIKSFSQIQKQYKLSVNNR